MTDRDREAFEAWWKTADRVVLDRYWAEEAWEAALDHAREAGAQEPVAVPEGYWLAPLTLTPELRAAGAAGSGEDSEAVAEGAYEAIRDAVLAAAPVSPAADSGEVERLREALRVIAEPIGDGVRIGDPWSFYADLQDVAREALASTPAPQPGGAVKQRVLERISVFASYSPEEGESWESWYHSAFDLLASEVAALEPSPSQWNAGAEATKTRARPLDLATMFKHAWIAGKTGVAWEDYDPTELIVYQRLAETLDIPLPTTAAKG